MLADVLAIFAIILTVARYFVASRDLMVSHKWAIADLLAIAIMIIATYFYLFPPASTITQTGTIATNTITGTTSNTIQTYNLTTSQTDPGIKINSFGFWMMMTFDFFFIVYNIIMLIKDFLDTNVYKVGE